MSAKALCYHDTKTAQLLRPFPSEKPFAAQIFGSDVNCMAEAAQMAIEISGADKDRDVTGCALGVASGCFKSVLGAQVNLLWGKAKEVKAGYQGAIGYCRADTLRNGCQAAVVTSADMAALQFGLICVNKEGFLPVFPFFNFSKKGFGKAK